MDTRAKRSLMPKADPEGVEYDANGDIKLTKDRFFDPWRIAHSDKLKAIVKEAQGMVASYEKHFQLRTRARKPKDQETFEQTVEAIICDMVFAHLSQDQRGTAVSLSNTVLEKKSRYRSPVYSSKLPDIVKIMATPEIDFIRFELGHEKSFANRGQRSLIWPGWRILDRTEFYSVTLNDIGRRPFKELVVLKAPKQDHRDEGQYLDYEETNLTSSLRSQIVEINEWLDQADIEIDDPELALRTQVSDRSLRRVFTRGSFETGGRLFGGFWQKMKKDDRYTILIDQEETVGLDFGQISVRLAYSLSQAQPPEGDLYQLGDYHPVYRPGIKKLLNSLLSSEKPLKRKPQGTKDLLPPRPIETLIADISARHPALVPLFSTAICHKLQSIESSIMVGILLRLKQEGIVGLPIHDGLVVSCSFEDKTREIMEEVALELTGVNIPVSTE